MKTFVFLLTLLRLAIAPFIYIFGVLLDSYWLVFWLFIIASFSDYLDGKLARRFQVESKLGSVLDPIADKILILFALLAVVMIDGNFYVALMGGFILAREFWVSALRELSANSNDLNATKVTFVAKLKTSVQFFAIAMFFLGEAAELAMLSFLASFVLLLALFLGLKSAIDYTYKTFHI